jgi:DNA repair protein RadC
MNLLIKDLPGPERPRERLLNQGPDALRTAELIAILLRTGSQGISALEVAEQLVARHQNLGTLSKASVDELRKQKGIGRDKAIALKSAFTLAKRMVHEVQTEKPLLDSPERVADLLREDVRSLNSEQLLVALVNTRRRLIQLEIVSQGTLDSLLVHPREVFRPAITANAAAIILAHNHPSGDPNPSEADIKVTRDIIRAGQLLKIEVLDHIILGSKSEERLTDYVSLRELGYFYS